jgi:maltose O-acetyltransferase
VAFKTLIFTLDPLTGEDRPVRIGSRCFIGGGSLILPGVTIGDECIIGAGSVVFDDVPPRSIAGGNPARIIRSDILVGPYGRLRT